MPRPDVFGLEVYHATTERPKGMRNDGIESLYSYRDLGGLPVISSDLFTYDLYQHPFLPPAGAEIRVNFQAQRESYLYGSFVRRLHCLGRVYP